MEPCPIPVLVRSCTTGTAAVESDVLCPCYVRAFQPRQVLPILQVGVDDEEHDSLPPACYPGTIQLATPLALLATVSQHIALLSLCP